MAGHSKWANIKHKKMREDAKRGAVFTKLARQITVAAKEGGPDPETNFKLRLAIDKAKAENVPNDNIERAIARGVGDAGGESYEEVVYEGYGPSGVAILLHSLTDNRNRTAGEIRHRFSKYGGNLGEAGCVSWMFSKKGLLVVDADGTDEDEMMLEALEAGAEDIVQDDGVYKIFTDPSYFQAVKQALDQSFVFLAAEIAMIPQNTVVVSGQEQELLEKLIDGLEDLDDVQEVYTNHDSAEG